MQEFFLDDKYTVTERHDDVAVIDYSNETIQSNLSNFTKLSTVDQ